MSGTVDKSALGREKSSARWFAVLLVLTACSGFSTYFSGNLQSIWVYWSYLAHALLGTLWVPVGGLYVWRHVRRTLGVRRVSAIIAGYLQALLFVFLAVGGLYIIGFGLGETTNWVLSSHVIAAFVLPGLLAAHLAAVLVHWRRQRGRFAQRLILTAATLRTTAVSLLLYAGLITAASLVYDHTRPAWSTHPAVADYEYSYGDTPFLPSQTQSASGGFVPVAQMANSRRCGACHAELYQQWLESAHSQAGSDPAYVKNINLLEEQRGTAATRYCEGCHAPVALLSGELSTGGRHGGTPGTPAFQEGVGCMGCHGISAQVHVKGVASYRFTPTDSYLFEHSEQALAIGLHNLLIRLHPQQHRSTMSRKAIFQPETCATCHESFMDKDMNQWGWVKIQDDYSSWVNSHFSGRSEHDFRPERVMRCQDCHFPLISAADPSADANGEVRSHRTPGANTVLPWLNGDQDQLDAVSRFLQARKLLIDIAEPTRGEATQTLRALDERLRPGRNDSPFYLYLGEATELNLSVTNAMVGHGFPGGTTDINEAWVYLKVSDAGGATVYESGVLDGQGQVDPEAHFYRSIPVDTEGEHVWRHDLFRMIGDTYKNTIAPGKSDWVRYRFEVPFWAKGHLSVTAILKYRKFNQRYAQWVLGERAQGIPVVDLARDSLIIPLRMRPPALGGTQPRASDRSTSLAKTE